MFRTFLFCAIIVVTLPFLTDAAINCYKDANHGTIDGCQYCGFSNLTYDVSGTFPDIQYYCLHELKLPVAGITCTKKNQCQTTKSTSTSGWSQVVSLYICDTDLCNDHCNNGNSYGLGIAVVLSALASFVLTK